MVEKAPLLAIEIVVGFGVPIAWGVWQLISLRRDNRKAAEEAAAKAAVSRADAASEMAASPAPPAN
jgi:predicted membrane-bound mannosyltransferase